MYVEDEAIYHVDEETVGYHFYLLMIIIT